MQIGLDNYPEQWTAKGDKFQILITIHSSDIFLYNSDVPFSPKIYNQGSSGKG